MQTSQAKSHSPDKVATKTAEAPQKAAVSAASAMRVPAWANGMGDQLPAGLVLQDASTVPGIQAKLAINQPNDPYEQEADRVADQVMRTPASTAQVQRKCACGGIAGPTGECEECAAKRKTLQRRATQQASQSTVPPIVNQALSSGNGQPLDATTRAFMEPRFGSDFSQVRVHTDAQAAESARSMSALAYTVGSDVVFGRGQYQPRTSGGQRLLAHELTHVLQQAHTLVQLAPTEAPTETPNIVQLRQLLQDDQENSAIALMGRLSRDEVRDVLASREFKELAISAFNNSEMYRGIRAMSGDLYPSLEWMFDEGTDWNKVRDVITHAPSGHQRVRTDNWMKKQFVSTCNDEEMTDAVDLLGGTLLQKLQWMNAEGSNWNLVKAKLQATSDTVEKTGLYGNKEMLDFFVDVCNNKEMAEAVDLLGGSLLQKLQWMNAEGSNWNLVKAKLQATSDAAEKIALYDKKEMLDFFVDVCNNKEMAEAVDLLGGSLLQKLWWMNAEGSNWNLVKAKLQATSDAVEKTGLYGNKEMLDFFVDVCNNKEMAEAVDLLGGSLLQKLWWMNAEGSNWNLVKAKLQATSDAAEKIALYDKKEMLDFFVDVCNNKEMAEAVDLLGGSLLQKLWWMNAEGSNWNLVKAKLQATSDAVEKIALYDKKEMLDFFVDVCNNKEMAEAVDLLGGTLLQKLRWMLEEGTNAELVFEVIRLSPVAELNPVATDKDIMARLKDELSKANFEQVQQMLNQGLLYKEEVERSYKEKHYEEEKPGSGSWKLQEFSGTGAYEIQYTRMQLKIIVRIKLKGEPTTTAQQTAWINEIKSHWNDQFHIENSRRLPIIFEPIFTDDNPHHTVKVQMGTERPDQGHWYIPGRGAGYDDVPHEFGHMLGLVDEYNLAKEDYKRLTGMEPPAGPEPPGGYTAPGLMGKQFGEPVEGRYLQAFLDWLNKHLLPGEHPYRWVTGP